MKEAALDMRMSPQIPLSASDIIHSSSSDTLADILKTFGEVDRPKRLARAIKEYDRNSPITTSTDLNECLRSILGSRPPVKLLAKLFQALRIAVNDELYELNTLLEKSISLLAPGGRLVVISYHSLEDRLVKRFISTHERGCICPKELPRCVCGNTQSFKRINKRVITPSDTEKRENVRARSAKLRIAERV
jgi:16S rRNA (cytosine1402-N4)-methyltransferase